MDLTLFQLVCLVVLALAYGFLTLQTPRGERKALWLTIAAIAAGAWLAENTAILRYRFYAYPDWWWLKLDEVPALVIAIWPVVILSSRAILDRLWPGLAGWRLALAVGLAVTVDATLIETIAADARLWRWSEGGYLGVPLIGMLGWGAFAAAMVWALEFSPKGFRLPRWAAPLLALGGTHLLLVLLWWGGLRFVGRGELPVELVWVAVAGGAALGWRVWLKRLEGMMMPATTALPRILASSVFILLLGYSDSPVTWALWVHLGAVALPYLVSVDWRGLLLRGQLPAG